MGGSSVSSTQWKHYTQKSTAGSATSAQQVYRRTNIKSEFNPTRFEFRESRDNTAQPESTPIVVGLDVTGSMDSVLLKTSKQIGDFASAIFEKGIIEGPQICVMGVGDVLCDEAPIQITQFESDTKILDQLEEIYFESGGGGNGEESYHVPWYYAAKHIKTDAYEKRNKKGILFTIGNDGPPSELSSRAIERFLGKRDETMSVETILNLASKKFDIYHIDISSGYRDSWKKLLGAERVICISESDVENISEVMLGICMALKGKSRTDIASTLTNQNIVNAVSVIKPSGDLVNGGNNTLVEF